MRQRLFVEELFVDFNKSAAAVRAGYSDTSRGGVERLVKRPAVAEAIKAGLDARMEDARIEELRLLTELRLIAFARLKTVADWGERDGKPFLEVKPAAKLSDAEAAAISEVSLSATGGLRVKLVDKQAALLALTRRLDMLLERAARVEATAGGAGLEPGEALAADLAGLPRQARDAIRQILLEHRPIEGVVVGREQEP
jgi:phage terminase small subunit